MQACPVPRAYFLPRLKTTPRPLSPRKSLYFSFGGSHETIRLVEQTEAHVLIGLLLLLLLLLLGGSLTGGGGGRGGSSAGTTGGNGSKLLGALGNQLYGGSVFVDFMNVKFSLRNTNLVDVLALKLGEELGETLLIGVNADSGENALDVGSGGRLVAGEAEEQVSGEVLHFESDAQNSVNTSRSK